MSAPTLPLSEVFGPVWQGEGPHTGRRCAFVRLGLCNLACEWCDTPYTWDTSRYDVAAECPETTVDEIRLRLAATDSRMVVLSGGEPMLHQAKPAMAALLELPTEWHVETNGTILPNQLMRDRIDHFTVSPKLITADPVKKRLKAKPLQAYAELAEVDQAIFKFVAATADDVDQAALLAADLGLADSSVWMMPEGVEPGAVLDHARAIADRTLHHGFNLTLRQHTLMYGQERAR